MESKIDLPHVEAADKLARVLHDARTPLATIKISTQLIARGTLSVDDTQRLSKKILDAVDRIDQLITDIACPK